MSHMHSFIPEGNTSLIGVTTTASTAAQISSGSVSGIRVANVGVVNVYLAIGDSTVTAVLPTTSAAAAGMPILPNSVETFDARPGCYLSAITTGGTAQLYATPGAGL